MADVPAQETVRRQDIVPARTQGSLRTTYKSDERLYGRTFKRSIFPAKVSVSPRILMDVMECQVMKGLRRFEIAYNKIQTKLLCVTADHLSRSDAYAEICFAEQLLIGHKPSDPALTFESLAKSAGIELVHVRAMEFDSA